MPCWFFEKKDIKLTPSYKDGVDQDTETRYRREGARFILDTGSKMGLRFETCSTGVVYFHRFYMFHSFREFHRYVTAATCLFLAGKVEETPKKCKDIIKWTKSMLTDKQFQVFGDDPREELMTMERILLQTIKFDLMIEHPYAKLLHFAKMLKGDKQKQQAIVQMAWTFINDSLCTTLCLQWESDIIAVALMYLASRLSRVDFPDWEGKVPGFKGKWYEGLIQDINVELIEDICHQVLDLYSSQNKQKEDSPPPPPPPPKPNDGGSTAGSNKRNRASTPDGSASGPPSKSMRKDGSRHRQSHSPSPLGRGASSDGDPNHSRKGKGNSPPHLSKDKSQSSHGSGSQSRSDISSSTGSGYNPYVTSFSSSYMTSEGNKKIMNILGGNAAPAPAPPAPQRTASAPYYGQPPPNDRQGGYRAPAAGSYTENPQSNYSQPPPPSASYGQPASGYQQSSQSQYNHAAYNQAQAPPQVAAQGSSYGQYAGSQHSGYAASNYSQPPPNYSQQQGGTVNNYPPPPNTAQPPPGYNQQQYSGGQYSSGSGSYAASGNPPPASPAQPPNQYGQQRPAYANQQANYQSYQQPPPPNAPMRPRAHAGMPGQGYGPRGPPRGPPPGHPRHVQPNAANPTPIQIAGRQRMPNKYPHQPR